MHRLEQQKIYKAIARGDRFILFSISSHNNKLTVDFLNGAPTPTESEAVAKYVYEWFDLATDLKPFYHHVKEDALLGPLVKKYFGYRIVGQPDLFES